MTIAGAGVLLVVGVRPRRGAPLVASAAFLALAAWTAISISWAPVADAARDETLRCLAYAAAFTALAAAVRSIDDLGRVVEALGIALGAATVAATTRLIASPPATWFDYDRLSWPTGYPNTDAAVLLLAAWTLVGLAATARLRPAPARRRPRGRRRSTSASSRSPRAAARPSRCCSRCRGAAGGAGSRAAAGAAGARGPRPGRGRPAAARRVRHRRVGRDCDGRSWCWSSPRSSPARRRPPSRAATGGRGCRSGAAGWPVSSPAWRCCWSRSPSPSMRRRASRAPGTPSPRPRSIPTAATRSG